MPKGTKCPCRPTACPKMPMISLLPIISLFTSFPNGLLAQFFTSQQQQIQMPSAQFLQPAVPLKPAQQQQILRISNYSPILKVKSNDGYLPSSAGHGTFVRIAPSNQAAPLQILVEDRDLMPGMPSAVYQYVLSGYGAERFAVDPQGNLYLNVDDLDTMDAVGTPNFVLHILAKEVDTSPQRISPPISLTIHVIDDDDPEQITSTTTVGPTLPQTIYVANVSALDADERVIAQVKAREGEGSGSILYRIVEVSDGAANSFRYDHNSHELRAVGPLFPGHRYKVVIEARDTEGLVGHAVVLIQALPPQTTQNLGRNPYHPASALVPDHPSTALLPAHPPGKPTDQQLALIPSSMWQQPNQQSPFWAVNPTTAQNPELMPFPTTGIPPPSTAHPTEQNVFVELSEATPPGSIVQILGSEEVMGRVKFVMKGGNEEGKFGMDENVGKVTTTGTFDREQTAHYTLHIEARSRAPVDQLLYVTNLHVEVLDINDNAPQFGGPYPIRLSIRLDEFPMNATEFAQPNMLLGRVEVTDPDHGKNGQVSLSVMPPLDRLFTISDAGDVRVNGALSSAHLGEHQLTLRAVDHGEPPLESRAVVSVKIDGHFASSIRESVLRGGPSPAVSNEGDHRRIFGSLGNSAASSVPISSSDYETGSEADGSSLFGISAPKNDRHYGVITSNEKQSPKLAPPFVRVDPRLNGASLLAIPSVRPQLTMPTPSSTIPPTPFTSFSPTAFNLFPTSSSPLQYTTLNLNIPSSSLQMPLPSVSSEELNMPRLAPIFDAPELKVFVEENEEQMELTKLRAHYPDGGPGSITYTLQAGDQSLFSVDPTSGRVTLLRALDAESERQPPVYRLKVGTAESERTDDFVMEPGLAHSCEMTIHVMDINDWIPNFEQKRYEFMISTTAGKGTVVGQATAYDQDLTAPNNKIHYELVDVPNRSIALPKNLFQVDADNGQIVLGAESVANFGGQTLEYLVKATDGGLEGTEQHSTTEVAILVEGMPKTTTMPTTTVDEQVVEEGTETTGGEQRLVEEAGGRTSATSSATVSPSPPPALTSMVVQQQQQQQQQQNAIKFVARELNATVAEGQRPPVLVKILEVLNKARDTRFTICAIRSGNIRGAFSVAPNSRGDCELRTQMQLDRESMAEYRLNVSIQNGEQMDSALVIVTVLDVNDNKPKFVFPPIWPDDDGEQQTGTYFAVLPEEMGPNEKFYTVTAQDADTVESGNGVVTYELDEQTAGSDAEFFGIDAKSGELFPKKKASEIAQLSRRDYFRVTAIAWDNPTDAAGGAAKKRLYSRVPVAIALLGDRHKFALFFAGIGADQIRQNEKEIAKSLRAFTEPCPQAKLLRVDEQSGDDGGSKVITTALMYAANVKERKLCQKLEFPKLFTDSVKQHLAGQMREWGAVLLDVQAEVENGRAGRTGDGQGGVGAVSARDGGGAGAMAALLFPIDWNSTSTMLIAIALAVALIALIGLCALFAFRARHQQMRRRAEQIRRRRGFSAGGGLLTVSNNNNKGPMNQMAFSQGIPSYAASSNISNNMYLPTTPLGASANGGAGGPFERTNKFYESQLLELPLGDDDGRAQGNHAMFANGNGMRFVGGRSAAASGGGIHEEVAGGGGRTMFRPQQVSTANPSNTSPRRQISDLLHPPPPLLTRHQHALNNGVIGRRLTTNSGDQFGCAMNNAAAIGEGCHRRHSPPQQNNGNQEGDFSIDESFYAANGQTGGRCIY